MLLDFTTQTSFTFFAKKFSIILPLKTLEKSIWAGFSGFNSWIIWVTVVVHSWPSLETSFQYQWKINNMQLKIVYPAKIVKNSVTVNEPFLYMLLVLDFKNI